MTDEEINNIAERAYWNFDARKKGYAEWKQAPQSERDAFKAEFRIALAETRKTQQTLLPSCFSDVFVNSNSDEIATINNITMAIAKSKTGPR